MGARAGGRGACRRPEPERLFLAARARFSEGASSGAASRPARPRRGAEDDTSAGGLAALVPAALVRASCAPRARGNLVRHPCFSIDDDEEMK